MTYKDSISLFNSRLKTISYGRNANVREMPVTNIMMEMSAAQNFLQSKYGIYESLHGLELIKDQSEYGTGSTANHIPADLMNIKTVEISGNDAPYEVCKVSKEQMNLVEKQSGLPCRYTVYGTNDARALEIDSIPGASYDASAYPAYKLNILYSPRLDIFDSSAGTGGTFSDWDMTAAGYGGEWKLPEEWHYLIVEGALAGVFPDIKQEFYLLAQEHYRSGPDYTDASLDHNLGIN